MAKDELGIEYDDEVDAILKDPKSSILSKTVDYMVRRSKVQEELSKREAEEKNKPEKLFGIF